MKHERRNQFAGIALILASAASFGSLSVLVTIAIRRGSPLGVVLQWRFTLAAIALAIVLRARLRIQQRSAIWLFALGLTAQATVTFVSLSALRYITAPALAFLFFTYPVWLAAFGALAGRVRLTGRRAVSLALALSGLFVMLQPGAAGGPDWRGVALAILSALMYAAYLPAISRHQRGVPPLTAAFYVILGAAVSFTISSIVTGQPLPADANAWRMIALIGLVPTVFAFTTLVAGVSILGAVRTSIVGTAEPFFTTMFAALLLSDAIGLASLLGGTLIAAAVVVDATTRRSAAANSS